MPGALTCARADDVLPACSFLSRNSTPFAICSATTRERAITFRDVKGHVFRAEAVNSAFLIFEYNSRRFSATPSDRDAAPVEAGGPQRAPFRCTHDSSWPSCPARIRDGVARGPATDDNEIVFVRFQATEKKGMEKI